MATWVQTLLAIAVATVTFSSTAGAQTGAVLSGVVRARAGEPVAGAVLTIVRPTDGETRVVVTDQSGTYFVDSLHYGVAYAVEVSHPRFRKSHLEARATEGEAPVDIALSPLPSRLARAALFPLRVLSFGLIG